MLIPEDLYNRLPVFSALVIREETPSPFPVGCMTYGLPELTRQYHGMVTSGHNFVLLLAAGGGPALPGSPFCLGIPHQARVQTPLPEVHAPRYPGPDLSGPADNQRLREDNVGEDDGSLGVPTPTENPPPFRGQNCREAVPYCSKGRVVPACCSVSKLVCHALWSGGAPLHGNLGCGMAGGSRQELELQDTPHLSPRSYREDVGHP